MQRTTILFLLVFPWVLQAQKKSLIYTERDTLSFQLTEKAGKLALEYAEFNTNAFTKKHFMAIQGLQLEDADLVLSYQVDEIEANFNYITSMLIINPANQVIAPPPFKAKGDLGKLNDGLFGQRSISWEDALEDVLLFGQTYRLVLSAEMWGPVACAEKRPTFTLQQQVPHLGIAAGGILLTGIGQFQKSKKVDAYNTYKTYHTTGESLVLAQPFYDKAKAYEKDARLFTYTGWAVLGLDAAVYLYRVFNTKARQKQYDKYCQDDALSLRLEPIRLGDGTNNLQLKFAFTLK